MDYTVYLVNTNEAPHHNNMRGPNCYTRTLHFLAAPSYQQVLDEVNRQLQLAGLPDRIIVGWEPRTHEGSMRYGFLNHDKTKQLMVDLMGKRWWINLNGGLGMKDWLNGAGQIPIQYELRLTELGKGEHPNNEREPHPKAKGKALTVIAQEWFAQVNENEQQRKELVNRAWAATMAACGGYTKEGE